MVLSVVRARELVSTVRAHAAASRSCGHRDCAVMWSTTVGMYCPAPLLSSNPRSNGCASSLQRLRHQASLRSAASSYESRRGTVVQFLDEFERDAIRKFPHHRFTIQRQKAMNAEFERNRWPGWLQFDIDFAMDGTIAYLHLRAAHSMQSDHWSPMSYTLFVNIVS